MAQTENKKVEVQTSQVAATVVSDLGNQGLISQNIETTNINNVYGMGNPLLPAMAYYNGYAIDDLVEIMVETKGLPASGGDAIKTAQILAEQIRMPLAFDADRIYAVIDSHISVDNKELLASICKDAVKQNKIKYGHRMLDEALKIRMTEDKSGAVNPYDVNPNLVPIPKRLPSLIKNLLACYPPEFHHAVIGCSMAMLAFYAEGVTAVYNDVEEYRLLFNVFNFTESAGGKSFIDRLKTLFLKRVIERDIQYYADEEKMKNAAASGKKKRGRKKKGEVAVEEPEQEAIKPRPIQYVGSTTSITELVYRTLNSDGHNLFMYNCEGSEFFLSCRRGPNTDIYSFMRKSVEGSEFVQGHHSVDTVSGICYPNMTVVICVQPEVAVPEFCKHITDGTTGRLYINSIEVKPGAKRPVIKPFSDKIKAEVDEVITYLQSLSETIKLKNVDKAINQWDNERITEFVQTDNLAIDHYRKRAAQMGYKAGVFYYLLNGRRDDKFASEFALYVAEYTFRQQMYFFGAEYNKQKQAGRAITGINNPNYYNELGETFTRDELIALRARHGESTNVRTIIHRWLHHTPQPLIEDKGNGVYKKLI